MGSVQTPWASPIRPPFTWPRTAAGKATKALPWLVTPPLSWPRLSKIGMPERTSVALSSKPFASAVAGDVPCFHLATPKTAEDRFSTWAKKERPVVVITSDLYPRPSCVATASLTRTVRRRGSDAPRMPCPCSTVSAASRRRPVLSGQSATLEPKALSVRQARRALPPLG